MNLAAVTLETSGLTVFMCPPISDLKCFTLARALMVSIRTPHKILSGPPALIAARITYEHSLDSGPTAARRCTDASA